MYFAGQLPHVRRGRSAGREAEMDPVLQRCDRDHFRDGVQLVQYGAARGSDAESTARIAGPIQIDLEQSLATHHLRHPFSQQTRSAGRKDSGEQEQAGGLFRRVRALSDAARGPERGQRADGGLSGQVLHKR